LRWHSKAGLIYRADYLSADLPPRKDKFAVPGDWPSDLRSSPRSRCPAKCTSKSARISASDPSSLLARQTMAKNAIVVHFGRCGRLVIVEDMPSRGRGFTENRIQSVVKRAFSFVECIWR